MIATVIRWFISPGRNILLTIVFSAALYVFVLWYRYVAGMRWARPGTTRVFTVLD